jgi:hypothetical protein
MKWKIKAMFETTNQQGISTMGLAAPSAPAHQGLLDFCMASRQHVVVFHGSIFLGTSKKKPCCLFSLFTNVC